MIQNEEIERALQRLRDVLKNTAENNRLCIAYSGGLDSRFLAFFASKCELEVELLHASAAHVSPSESQNAVDRAQAMGLTVRVVHPPLPSPEALAAAGRNRCYVCKRSIFSFLQKQSSAPLCDGSNASDALVFRPGSRAIKELGVHTPLADAGLTKPMIRAAAVRLGLPDPQQPARPCLLTRFDYGDAPDARRLRLTQQVEDFLSELPELKAGFRLRWLGDQPLLHVASANRFSSEELGGIQTRLTESFPELGSVHIEVMDNLSGWFDWRREVADAYDRAPERLMQGLADTALVQTDARPSATQPAYCLVPDFFRIGMLNCCSASSIMCEYPALRIFSRSRAFLSLLISLRASDRVSSLESTSGFCEVSDNKLSSI